MAAIWTTTIRTGCAARNNAEKKENTNKILTNMFNITGDSFAVCILHMRFGGCAPCWRPRILHSDAARANRTPITRRKQLIRADVAAVSVTRSVSSADLLQVVHQKLFDWKRVRWRWRKDMISTTICRNEKITNNQLRYQFVHASLVDYLKL